MVALGSVHSEGDVKIDVAVVGNFLPYQGKGESKTAHVHRGDCNRPKFSRRNEHGRSTNRQTSKRRRAKGASGAKQSGARADNGHADT